MSQSQDPGSRPHNGPTRRAAAVAGVRARRVLGAVLVLAALAFASMASGNRALAQGTSPTVSSISITSDPGSDSVYKSGDAITVAVTFSEAVTVLGRPNLKITIGANEAVAPYVSSTGAVVTFQYTTVEGDLDTGGISIPADSIDLNSGSIRAGSRDATLTHGALTSTHQVDAVSPTVSITYDGSEGVDYVAPTRTFRIRFAFSKPVSGFVLSDVRVLNGTASSFGVLAAEPGFPAHTRWEANVLPRGVGPVLVSVGGGAATDDAGNGNAHSNSLLLYAASPQLVNVQLAAGGLFEGGTQAFTLTRSSSAGRLVVLVTITQTGDFSDGTVLISNSSDPANPQSRSLAAPAATLSITFAAGEATKRIELPTTDDAEDETDGEFLLSVDLDTGQYSYRPGPQSMATATVLDNDKPTVLSIYWLHSTTLDGSDQRADIEGGFAIFVLDRSGTSTALTLDAQVTSTGGYLDLDGEGALGYSIAQANRIRIPVTRSSTLVIIPLEGDETRNADGTITLTLATPPADAEYSLHPTKRAATSTIFDNDAPPSILITAIESPIAEGETARFTLSRSGSVIEHTRLVQVTVAMTQSGDFITPRRRAWQFEANQMSRSIEIDTTDDETPERQGSVTATVSVSADGSYVVGSPSAASVAIDDDDGPLLAISPVNAQVVEGSGAVYALERIGDTSGRFVVGLYVTGHEKVMTAATKAIVTNSEQPGQRYDTTVVFEPGDVWQMLTLTTAADNVVEGNGQITVRVTRSPDGSYLRGESDSAQVIVEDDDVPTVSIASVITPSGATLSADGATWEALLEEGEPIRIQYQCSGAFEYPTPRGDDRFQILNTWVQELNHPAFYSHRFNPGLNFMAYGGAYVTTPDCSALFNAVDQGHRQRWVGPDGGTVRIDILPFDTVYPPLFEAAQAAYQAARAEAAHPGEPLTTPGLFSTIAVPDHPTHRGLLDRERPFVPRYQIGTPNAVRLTLVNRSPAILIKAVADEVTEGGTASFTIERRWNADNLSDMSVFGETVVLLSVSTKGPFVSQTLPVSVRFASGETTKTVTIQTTNDTAHTADGSVTIELLPDTTGTGLNLGAKYSTASNWVGHTPAGKRSDRATVAIRDDDTIPGISVEDVSVQENAGPLVFTVTVDPVPASLVTISWNTKNGTAMAGSDYTATTSGTLTIPVGSATGTISIPITDDALLEPDEHFNLVITAATGAGVPGGSELTARATILNDDLPSLTVTADPSEIEEGTDAVFTFARTGDTSAPLVLRFLYEQANIPEIRPLVAFASGDATTNFRAPWPDNQRVDTESVALTATLIVDSTRWVVGSPSSATITVTDNDTYPEVTVRAATLAVEEGGTVQFTLSRTGPPHRALTVYLTLTDPSGTSTRRNVTFPANGSTATLSITTTDDSQVSDASTARSYTATLPARAGVGTPAEPWVPGDPSSATVTLIDNDAARGLGLSATAPAVVAQGQSVTITFTVSNTGAQTSRSPISVTTDRTGFSGCQLSSALAADASASCTASFTVTSGDVTAAAITIVASAGDGTTTSNSLTISMTAVAQPEVGFTARNVVVTEGTDTSAEIPLGTSAILTPPVSVTYQVVPWGSFPATAPADFVDNSGTFTFPADSTSGTLSVSIADDMLTESTEQFRVVLTTSTVASVDPDNDTVTVWITDDDTELPEVTLEVVSAPPHWESGPPVEFRVRLSRASGQTVSVTVYTTPGTTIGNDYVSFAGVGVLPISIAPGETEATFSIALVDDDIFEQSEAFGVGLRVDSSSNATLGDPHVQVVTISDDDGARSDVLTLVATPNSVNESAGEAEITFSATLDGAPFSTPTTVSLLVVARGTTGASAGADYELPSDITIVIPIGHSTAAAQAILKILDDDINEVAETIEVRGVIVVTDQSAAQSGLDVVPDTITIEDDDTLGVSVTPTSLTLDEGASGSYTVVLDTRPEEDVSIAINVPANANLRVNPSRLTFTPATWNQVRTVDVAAVDDGDADSANNADVTLSHTVSGGGYAGVLVDSVTVSINETTMPVLGVADIREAEDSDRMYFTVTITPAAPAALTTNYRTIAGTATEGVDYEGEGEGSGTAPTPILSIPRGSTTIGVTVDLNDDNQDEADEETFTLTFSNLTGPAQFPGGAATMSAAGVILDDDDAPTLTIAGPGGALSEVQESAASVDVTLSLDGASDRVVSVSLETADLAGGGASATSGEDYTALATTAEFQPGDQSGTVSVPILDDSDTEPLEFFGVRTSSIRNGVLPGAGLGGRSTRFVIVDDDGPGLVIAPTSLSITEEGGSASYTVSLATRPAAEVRVNIGGAIGTDLSISATRLTFTRQNWDTDQTVTVSSVHDDDSAPDTVVLTHSATSTDSDYSGLSGNGVTVTVTDNDTPMVTVSPTRVGVAEGGSNTYTIRLATQPTADVTVTIDDPTANTEVTAAPDELTFTSTNWATAQTVTVSAAVDADTDNDDATITHTAAGAEYEGVSVPDVTVRVIEDISVEYGAATYAVGEGETVDVTLTLSADPERTVTVPLTATAQGDATAGDYTAPASVTFNSGETSAVVTFGATQDEDDDNAEQVVLGFPATLPTGITAGSVNEATVTITDDDAPDSVAVSWGAATYTVTEGGTQEITVELDKAPERAVTIGLRAQQRSYTVSAGGLITERVVAWTGGATAPDFSGVPASVTFDSDETSQTITFAATDDTVDDDDETVELLFAVTLPDGIVAGTQPTTTVSITDNDAPDNVYVFFGATAYTVGEGSDVSVEVELNQDPERTVTIPITATPGDGAEAADFSGVPNNVTFAAGETLQAIAFAATDDTADDDDETVALGFGTPPSGVTAGTPSATTVKITDDDDPAVTVSFGESSYTVGEGSSVSVTVSLDADPERTVVIPITATPGGGGEAADFSGVPPNVTFAAGETSQDIVFAATDDTVDDDDETVVLGFGTLPSGVSAGTTSTTTVNITDDDDPAVTVSFGAASYTVTEGSTVSVEVKLDQDPERTVVIPITSTPGDGATTADYSGVPQNVTFNSGETSKAIAFAATDDAADDDDETVALGFGTPPTGVTAGTTSTTTVNITDNDAPGLVISPTSLSITEEGVSASYTVRLAMRPTAEVRVNIGGAFGSDLSISATRLTFTRQNWDTDQTVTVSSVHDDDSATDTVVLTHGATSSGSDYSGLSGASVTVTVTDNDTPMVTVSPARVGMAEGGSNTYTILLATQPTADVTVIDRRSNREHGGHGRARRAHVHVDQLGDRADGHGERGGRRGHGQRRRHDHTHGGRGRVRGRVGARRDGAGDRGYQRRVRRGDVRGGRG